MSVELARLYLDAWAPAAIRADGSGIRAMLWQMKGGFGPYFLKGNPMEVLELLWVLNPLFAGDDQAPYREAPYDAACEAGVDAMLEEAAACDQLLIEIESIGHGRVLYERQKQALVTVTANAAANATLLLPRPDLPLVLRQGAVVLLWLHAMVLPFEIGTSTPRALRQ